MSTSLSTASAPARGFRKDIAGLRGFAIALVVIFHIWVGKVSSGVDVFLFLGGFFLISSQLRRVEVSGSWLGSMSRIAQRIYPPMIFVVFATVIAGLLVFPITRWEDLFREALPAATGWMNIQLMLDGSDYGAASKSVSVFQHLWSMGVQLQVYAVVILLVSVAWFISRRRRWFVVSTLAVVTAGSFAYAWVNVGSTVNYFHPFSRLWEITAGGLFALLISTVVIPAWASWVAYIAGFGAIISVGLFLDGAAQFPGPWALLPLTGAALVILAGQTPTPTLVNKTLSSPMFQWVGNRAYTLYLTHWPILILSTYLTPSPWRPWGVLAVSLAATALLYNVERFVKPTGPKNLNWVESARHLTTPGVVSFLLATALALTGTQTAPTILTRWHDPSTTTTTASPETYPGANASLNNTPPPPRPPVFTAPVDIAAMMPATQTDGCFAGYDGDFIVDHHGGNTTDIPCEYGDTGSNRVLYIAGGSHSEHFLPAFDILGKRKGFKVVPLLKMSCPLSPNPLPDGSPYPQCDTWTRNVTERVKANPGIGVVMTDTRPENHDGSGPDHTPAGYVDTIRELASVTTVYGIRDTPWIPSRSDGRTPDVRECMADGGTAEECGTILVNHPEDPSVEALEGIDNVRHADVTKALCPDGHFCPAVIGGMMVWRDSNHLSAKFAETLADELDRQLNVGDDLPATTTTTPQK